MLDKEKIKQEIEIVVNRRLNLLNGDYFILNEETKGFTNEIMEIIDSLSEESKCVYNRTLGERKKYCKFCSVACYARIEEPASEDFEKEYDNYFKEHETDIVLNPYTNCKDIARHFAKWGRNHFKNNSETVNEDLEKATSEYVKEDFHERSRADFKAGAEWQKEQMMRDAVDAIVHKGLYSKYVKEQDSDALNKALEKYNPGNKVKIIIVKEEQQ